MEAQEVRIHPIYDQAFSSSEHPEGQLNHVGDALGRDCVIHKFVDGWMRFYRGDGKRNEDWYGWQADVLAPFDGTVEDIYINPITNVPGVISAGTRASRMVFVRSDGIRVVYVHVMNVTVENGSRVSAGDVVAKVGNNGYSRHPHIHVGAWKGQTPLQISFDLQMMGKQLRERGERKYMLPDDQNR